MNGDKVRSNKYFKGALGLICIAILGFFVYISTLSSRISFTSPFSIVESTPSVSILIVGDLMLDRNVRNKISEIGFDAYFAGVHDLVSDADFAVANLEGPFTSRVRN